MIYENVLLHNAREIIKHPRTGEMAISRIPDDVRVHMNALMRDETVFNCAGVEMRFKVNSGIVKINVQLLNMCKDGEVFDVANVYLGSFQIPEPFYISTKPSEIVIDISKYDIETMKVITEKHNLPWDVDVVRVILPYGSHIKINSIEGDISPIVSEKTPDIKWLAYGSSITNGSCANSTNANYVFKTAESLGIDVYNLGFAGSAQLEPEVADFIAEIGRRGEWDIATLELGVNMIWDSVKNCKGDIDLFEKRVDYFIDTIVSANPDKKIFVMDIFSNSSDYKPQDVEEISRYRKIVADKVKKIDLGNVIYIPATSILCDGVGLTADMIHPSARGMTQMYENLRGVLKNNIF